MKVLVVPDSFKGSLSARDVCLTVKEAIKSVDTSCEIHTMPMADGGEGTTEALVYNMGGVYVRCAAHDALHRAITAQYGISEDGSTAMMEMAAAAGIMKIPVDKLNPLQATTVGVGEMIRSALDHGCKKILLGIGGSATNDAGTGMLHALGYRFYDMNNREVYPCGENLIKITRIDDASVDKRLHHAAIEVACDVDNVLLGAHGATYTYGEQKGANSAMRAELEEGMKNFAKVAKAYTAVDLNTIRGGGAAGGLGATLISFLHARMRSGFDMVKNAVDLENTIKKNQYDYIITGEGAIDSQTMHGKLPAGIANLGKQYNIPVIGIVGSIGEGYEALFDEGMTSVVSIVNKPMSIQEAMRNAKGLLFDTAVRVFRILIRKETI